MSVAATCEMKTNTDNNVIPLMVNGIKQSSNNIAVHAAKPIQNHLCTLSEISTTGPHKNLHKLADTPSATIPAVTATGKPFFVSKKGRTTVKNPLLMPA